MTLFDDRETAFEAKFAHDAEMQFRAEARRDRLTGLWAAELLGKTGDDAAAYAMSVVAADVEKPGVDDVVAKLAADLGGKASVATIREMLARFLIMAKTQLVDEF